MRKAVFVIGPSRSGTSVLALALGRHTRIFTTEELHYYNLLQPTAFSGGHDEAWLWARLRAIQYDAQFFAIKNGSLSDLPSPDPAELPAGETPLLRGFLERLAVEANADVVVEQTPMNLYYRDEIRRDLPQAMFILMRRDPRAIIASQKMRWKVGSHGQRHIPERDISRVRYSGHPLLQLMLLRKTISEMRRAMTEEDVALIAYEDLVTNPERVLNDIARRLGIEFEPGMLAVTDGGSSHAREGGHVGFDPGRLESWRESLTETEIWLTEKAYRDLLVMPATGARPRLGEALGLMLSMPWSLAKALHYSSSSYGNVVDALRRRFM